MKSTIARVLVSMALLAHCSNAPPTSDAGVDAAPDQVADSPADVSDASVDANEASLDVSAEDVVEAAPACDPNKPFDPPVEITELSNIGNLYGLPRLTHDELTVYFDSMDNGVDSGLVWSGADDLVTAKRTSLTTPFTTFATLSSINTAGEEYHPSPSGDDLTLVYAAQPSTSVDILMATRATTTAPFGNVTPLSIDTSDTEWYPFLMSDTLTLYYSLVTSSNNPDLVRATRAKTTDPFTIDTSGVLAAVNSPIFSEVAPALSADELTLYFASDHNGNNGYDIYVSTRQSMSSPFGTPNQFPYNSSYADRPGFISDDSCRLYISSNRSGPSKIYVATRPL